MTRQETPNDQWCIGCDPDNCCGCGPLVRMSDDFTREYRVLIERLDLHGPSVYYRTDVREFADLQVRQDAERYRESEPQTRVWIESRLVGTWEADK